MALVLSLAAACGDPPADRLPGPDLLDDPGFEIVETITVDDRGFAPDEVTIVAGEGVELVNGGDGPHGFDGGAEFGTGLLEPGERSTLVLTEAGDYPFVDSADPAREGRIVVDPDPDDPETE